MGEGGKNFRNRFKEMLSEREHVVCNADGIDSSFLERGEQHLMRECVCLFCVSKLKVKRPMFQIRFQN